MSEVVEHELQEGDLGSRSIARDAGWNMLARLFAMAASSVTALIVANALDRSEYGAYAIVVGINVVLVMALDVGLTSSLARYVAQGRADTRLVVSVAAARLALVGAAALVVLASPLVLAQGSVLRPLMPMLAMLVVAQSIIAFHFGTLPSLRRMRLLLLVTVLQPAAELALVLYARARGGDAGDMLLATASSALVVGTLTWVLLLLPGRAAAAAVPDATGQDRAALRVVWRYGTRIFLVSLFIAVFGQVNQFVIGAFRPLAEVAPYALAIKLQALLAAPAITVAGIVAPRIAGAGADGLRLYRQWLGFLIALGLGSVGVLAVLSAETFGAIGEQYRDESLLLVAMAPFLLLSTLAPLPSIALNQTGHAGSRLRITAIAVAANFALALALVPWLGAWGAVVAASVAYLYYFLRHHRLLDRELAATAAAPPLPLRGLVVRSVAMAAASCVVAALVRLLMHRLWDPVDLVVVLVAGGVAGALHGWWSSRIVRGPARAK